MFSKILFAVTVTFAFLSCANPLQAENEKEHIRVGYVKGFGTIRNLSSADNKGYGFDIFSRIELSSDYIFDFVAFDDYKEMTEALESRELDMAGPALRREDHESKFLYSQRPISTSQILLASKNSDIPYYYNDPKIIHGKTIASYTDSPLEIYLSDYCLKNGISVKYVRADMKNYHELEADFYLISNINANVADFEMVLPLALYDNYFLIHPSHTALRAKFGIAFEELIMADGDFLSRLYLKYYQKNDLARRFLTKEEANLLQSKRLRVGYVSNHAPMSYQNVAGKADGIAARVLNYLAEEYDFEVEYIPYTLEDDPKQRENFDMLISLVGDIQAESKHFFTTAPYAEQDFFLMLPYQGKIDYALGIIDYLTLDKNALQSFYPDVQINVYDNTWDFFGAYLSDEIEGAIVTSSSVDFIAPLISGEDVILEPTPYALPFKFFVSKKLDPAYLNIFNVMIRRINEEKLTGILTNAVLDAAPNTPFSILIQRYAPRIGFLLGFLVIIISVILLYQEHKKRKAVLKVAYVDSITGHISYARFIEFAEAKIAKARAGTYEIVSCDIDLFKRINTYYGVEVGNKVLRAISQRLEEVLDEKSIFARTSIDHFIILYGGPKTAEAKWKLIQDVAIVIGKVIGNNYNVSLSIGSYTVVDPTKPFTYMIDLADSVRLLGKKDYKTTAYMFTSEMEEDFATKLKITHSMKDALKNEDFYILMQPKIDFQKGRICGAEALVRWKFSDGSIIYPDKFIPEFEQNGFIVELDLYVLKKVCEFIQANQDLFNDTMSIAVNLSAVTMLERNIVPRIISMLKKYDIDFKNIELEITESAMVGSEGEIFDKIHDLKIHKIKIAVDDFGSGLSSLNRLGALDADVLKMDKSFLDYYTSSNKNDIIIANTILLSKQLGMTVVAEGIETMEQASWLKSIGCDIAQGYYFERPMFSDTFRQIAISKKTYFV